MGREEQSIIGTLLILFGITWVGFAAVQPIPQYTTCYNGFPSPIGYPTCGFPGPIAVLFYALGGFAIVIGIVLFALRAMNKPKIQAPDGSPAAPGSTLSRSLVRPGRPVCG